MTDFVSAYGSVTSPSTDCANVCASDCLSVDRVAARIETVTVEETFFLACRQTIFIHDMQTEQVE